MDRFIGFGTGSSSVKLSRGNAYFLILIDGGGAMSRVVLGLIDDLFFTSKIAATASICAVSVTFAKDQEDLLKKAHEMKPSLILIDLSKDTLNPLEAVQTLKADTELRTIPVIGFYSHVQTELKEKALNSGCNTVVPRSFFSQHLAMILSDGL